MKDPFFLAPVPWLSNAVQPLADFFNLSTLPLHVHEILFGFCLYSVIYYPISPLLSASLFPRHYSRLSGRTRLNWDVHVVSLVQSSLINIAALWVIYADDERRSMDWEERVWGYTGGAGMIQGLVAGYFLWDFAVSVRHFDVFGPGALAHATCALSVYTLGFRPLINYYSPIFILWELSTPFLNFHWFMDKLKMTGSRLQLYNGIVLLLSFFGARLAWGTYESSWVLRDLWKSLQTTPSIVHFESESATMLFANAATNTPFWAAAAVALSNMTLNSLNLYWFVKMISAVKKRFPSEPKIGKGAKHGPSQVENAPLGGDAGLRKRKT